MAGRASARTAEGSANEAVAMGFCSAGGWIGSGESGWRVGLAALGPRAQMRPDRRSTRLESSHRSFTGRFMAYSMLLLKRPVGVIKYYIAASVELENLPVTTTKGAVFL